MNLFKISEIAGVIWFSILECNLLSMDKFSLLSDYRQFISPFCSKELLFIFYRIFKSNQGFQQFMKLCLVQNFEKKKDLEMFSEKMCSFPRIFILYVHLLSCPQCFPILYFYLQYLLMGIVRRAGVKKTIYGITCTQQGYSDKPMEDV